MRFSSFDIETFVGDDKFLKAYCLCYNIRGLSGYFYGLNCVRDFLEMLMGLDEPETFYAHNLTFDATFIIRELSKRNITPTSLMLNCTIYYIFFTNLKEIRITLKCSYKLIPIGLPNVHKVLNIESKLNFEHKKVNISNFEDQDIKDQVLKYCAQDVKIVQDLMLILKESLRCTNYDWMAHSNSVSSISINLFKRLFNTHQIPLKIPKELDEKIRCAYYGGRCEVFGNAYADEKVYHFDFSGMYAQCMLEKYPYGSIRYVNSPTKIEECGFYQITFSSNMSIPILPHRDLISKKLLFVNGTINGFFWSEEIRYFTNNGGSVDKIH